MIYVNSFLLTELLICGIVCLTALCMQYLLTCLKQDWINFGWTRKPGNNLRLSCRNSRNRKSKWNLLVIVSRLSYYCSIEEAGKEATCLCSHISSTSTSTVQCTITGPCHTPSVRTLQHVTVPVRNIYPLIFIHKQITIILFPLQSL